MSGVERAGMAADRNEPVVLSLLSDTVTPVSVFERLSAGEGASFLFESTEGDSRLARFSIIGFDPVRTYSFKDGSVTVLEKGRSHARIESADDPLIYLQKELRSCGMRVATPAEIPFAGGLVGYMGYGATASFDGIERQDADPLAVPEAFYGLYDAVVIFDHQFRRIKVVSHRGAEHAALVVEQLKAPARLVPIADAECEVDDSEVFEGVGGSMSRAQFIDMVESAKKFIVEGQVFQIVVSHRFTLPCSRDPLTVYRLLQALNPSPYAYILRCPGYAYLGSSPETFVKCQDGRVVLRALAGTRARGRSAAEDELLEAELRTDEKELAEHRMLVDLGRNDLGRVCKVGSISVGALASVTRYTHVMHLATEITGELRDDRTCFDVFRGCFPRGTVSGAPKIRAMQLLSRLEPERRGIYSGVVGYFDLGGNMDGAIAIRSALVKDGQAHVNAGAGIVFDSRPDMEYEETRNKARSVLKAVKLAGRCG